MNFQFNFVGKLLGPKGNSLKRLQEETMTKMAILGRGSMRDKAKVRKITRILYEHKQILICEIYCAGRRITKLIRPEIFSSQ